MNTMWRSCAILSLCAAMGGVVSAIAWGLRAPPLLPGAMAVFVCCSALLGVMLWIQKRSYAETFAAWTALLITAIYAVFIAYNHEYFVSHNVSFRPFLGSKLMAMLLPMVCPPRRWVGWSMLAILGIFPFFQFVWWDEVRRADVGIQEPYVTLVIVIAAGIIYHYKLKYSEVLASEMESTIHAKALQRFASMLIASQHLINTPLQKIELLVELMMAEKEPLDPLVVIRLRENFEVIRRVTRVLSFADGNTQWESLNLPANASELEDHARKVLKEFNSRSD